MSNRQIAITIVLYTFLSEICRRRQISLSRRTTAKDSVKVWVTSSVGQQVFFALEEPEQGEQGHAGQDRRQVDHAVEAERAGE